MPEQQTEQAPSAWERLKRWLSALFDIHSDMMAYEELDRMMEENTIIHGSNMWILMMAILIASIGLNVNSTAVIIGAMLISPLMSGILTMGYSLAVRDLTLLRRALARFGVQVLISLATSTAYFLVTPLTDPTAEMIARTSPTIWDVLIALFGGIAGIIGNTRQKKGNVIPGVAIATALMPPLCTVGYGIATLQPQFIFGALYLFAINTLFIALSAAFVTAVMKVPAHQSLDSKKQRKINRIIVVITVVTVVPSVVIGAYTVYSSYMEHGVSDYLKKEFVFSDTQLVQSSVDRSEKLIRVALVGTPISDEAIGALQASLADYNLDGYTLHVTQNSVLPDVETDDTDKITIAIQENTISELRTQLSEQREKLDALESSLAAQVDFDEVAWKAGQIFPALSGCRCGMIADSGNDYIILAASAAEPLPESEIQIIENWLRIESGLTQAKLFLDVQNVPEPEPEPPEPEQELPPDGAG